MFPFVFVQGDNDCVTEILWEVSLLPAANEEFVEFDIECCMVLRFSKSLMGCTTIPAAFPLFNCSMAFSVSCSVWTV